MLRDYAPCLPTKVLKAPSGDGWVHEIKHDGFRLIARKVAGQVHLYTKEGHDWAQRFPLVVKGLNALRVSSIVLDGEVLCLTDGREDFDKPWGQQHNDIAQFCAFDLLELKGVDWRAKPLLKRKARQQKLFARGIPGLQYVEHIEGDGRFIFEQACIEGIVSKTGGSAVYAMPVQGLAKNQESSAPLDRAGARGFRADRTQCNLLTESAIPLEPRLLQMSNRKQSHPIDALVGDRMRILRIKLGMTQGQLGEVLGITYQMVQKYENATNRISASRLYAIGTALGVPISYFFEGASKLGKR